MHSNYFDNCNVMLKIHISEYTKVLIFNLFLALLVPEVRWLQLLQEI